MRGPSTPIACSMSRSSGLIGKKREAYLTQLYKRASCSCSLGVNYVNMLNSRTLQVRQDRYWRPSEHLCSYISR